MQAHQLAANNTRPTHHSARVAPASSWLRYDTTSPGPGPRSCGAFGGAPDRPSRSVPSEDMGGPHLRNVLSDMEIAPGALARYEFRCEDLSRGTARAWWVDLAYTRTCAWCERDTVPSYSSGFLLPSHGTQRGSARPRLALDQMSHAGVMSWMGLARSSSAPAPFLRSRSEVPNLDRGPNQGTGPAGRARGVEASDPSPSLRQPAISSQPPRQVPSADRRCTLHAWEAHGCPNHLVRFVSPRNQCQKSGDRWMA